MSEDLLSQREEKEAQVCVLVCVCVCVGACCDGGPSGTPYSNLEWSEGAGGQKSQGEGGRLTFQTLRQEARQSPKHTHTLSVQ